MLAVEPFNLVPGYAKEPRPKRGVPQKARQAAEGGQKDVLDDVVDDIGARREPMSHVCVQRFRLVSHKPGGCFPVLLENGRDQLSLRYGARVDGWRQLCRG